MDPFKSLKSQFASMVGEAVEVLYKDTGIDGDDIYTSISVPESKHGDLSCSISLRVAAVKKTNPNLVAKAIAEACNPGKGISKVQVAGGYINAWFDEKSFAKSVIDNVIASGNDYGSSVMGKGIRVTVESPSVNPNKSWHVGHLRNALRGDSVSRTMHFCGYKVERENYIDDLGLQMAESVWSYMNTSNKPDKKFDQWLGEQYVEVNRKLEDPKIKSEVETLLKKMEDGGTLEAATARDIAERCVKAQYETAGNYRIWHDVLIWEGDILREKLVESAIEIAKRNSMLSIPVEGKYKGCIIVDLGKSKSLASEIKNAEEDKKVLVRSNGTATYIAKDFAFHLWKLGLINANFKYKKFIEQSEKHELYTTSGRGEHMDFGNADIVVNVIGSAQRFQQLILKALVEEASGSGKSKEIVHLSYGEVAISGGTLSGRKGGWMGEKVNYTADDLLAEISGKAKELIENKNVENQSDKDSIAREVALSAIRFEFLRQAPEKAMMFSWEKALNFESNSGPYCMYTYARASKILGKETAGRLGESDFGSIARDNAFELIKTISYAQDVIEKACREYRPNVIVDYALELAYRFSSFYETMPVLKGGEAKRLRLAITHATCITMGNLLNLLGISPLENM